jgi:hypothetical protein
VLLSPETIARMLAATGHDPTLAKHMPHGAIRFRAETDKQGYEDVSPISAPTRQALERYLRAHPRVGDVWMFPQPKHPERPINETLARILRIRAERLAELPLVEREGFIRTDVRTLPIGSIFPTSTCAVCGLARPRDDEAILPTTRPRDDAARDRKRARNVLERTHFGHTPEGKRRPVNGLGS